MIKWPAHGRWPETRAELDAVNAQLAEETAKIRVKAIAEFNKKVAEGQPLSEEDVEDFGGAHGVPEGYERESTWSGRFVWRDK